jgi:hypothetical protein
MRQISPPLPPASPNASAPVHHVYYCFHLLTADLKAFLQMAFISLPAKESGNLTLELGAKLYEKIKLSMKESSRLSSSA